MRVKNCFIWFWYLISDLFKKDSRHTSCYITSWGKTPAILVTTWRACIPKHVNWSGAGVRWSEVTARTAQSFPAWSRRRSWPGSRWCLGAGWSQEARAGRPAWRGCEVRGWRGCLLEAPCDSGCCPCSPVLQQVLRAGALEKTERLLGFWPALDWTAEKEKK